jgi:hypothetical protein
VQYYHQEEKQKEKEKEKEKEKPEEKQKPIQECIDMPKDSTYRKKRPLNETNMLKCDFERDKENREMNTVCNIIHLPLQDNETLRHGKLHLHDKTNKTATTTAAKTTTTLLRIEHVINNNITPAKSSKRQEKEKDHKAKRCKRL